MNIGIIIAIVAAIALGVGAYFVFFKKKAAGVTGTTSLPSGWTIQYSPNMPSQMTQGSDGTYFFEFPSQDGIHYVVEPAPPLAIGRIISMKCSITGNGTIVPTEYPEHGPRVRLYMQRKGDTMSGAGEYQQYRYWSVGNFVPAIGDFELTVPLNADLWSDVFGAKGSDHQDGFIACVANAQVIGFTFGGDMAGHGDYVVGGSARFTLKSFTVQ